MTLSPSLTLSNTILVPSLSHKLLSISQVTTDLNCIVLIYPTFCLLQDILTKEIIGRGTKRGGLYCMDDFSVGRVHHMHHPSGTKEMLGYGQNIQSNLNINAAEFKNFYPLTHQGSHAFHKNRRKGKRNLPFVDRFVKPSKSRSWFIRIFKGTAFLKSDQPLQVSTHEQIINDLVEC